MSKKLGSGPIQPSLYTLMNKLAHALDTAFNPDKKKREVGFVLLSFPFGESHGGRCNYISNAEREDIVTLLKEQLSYFEGMPDDQYVRPQ
jgi:hypothetical protein